MNRIKVVAVEDDPQIRAGIEALIKPCDDLYFVKSYSDAESFRNEFKHLDVDVVLMDIKLPGQSGIEIVAELSNMPGKEKISFLMCTDYSDDDKVWNAIRFGAKGYILKSSLHKNLINFIKILYEEGSAFTPSIARKVVQFFQHDQKNKEKLDTLTKREFEIMDLVIKGFPDKMIADELKLATTTVAKHCSNIYAKLHVHNRIEAINMLSQKTKR